MIPDIANTTKKNTNLIEIPFLLETHNLVLATRFYIK